MPRNLDDVKNFAVTAPFITDVTPSSLSWASDDTAEKTVTIEGVNFNGFTLSSLTSFNASVEGTTVKISPKAANTGDTDIKETLTITATGGNDATVTLTQLKKSSGGGATPGAAYVWSLAKDDLGTTGSPAASVSKGMPELIWSTSYTWPANATKAFNWDTQYKRGVQIGTGNATNKCESLVLSTTAYEGGVQTVVVGSNTASSGNAELTVKVGDTVFTCDGDASVKLNTSTTPTTYTFTSPVPVEGKIVLSWTNSAAKALYLASIAINPAE